MTVNMLVSSAEDWIFKSDRMNAFLQSTQHKAVKTGWYGVRILCPRTATCLHAEFCLCVLDTTISNSWHCSSVKPGIIVTISSNVTFRRYIADINYYLVWSNNHRFLVGFVLLSLIVLCVRVAQSYSFVCSCCSIL